MQKGKLTLEAKLKKIFPTANVRITQSSIKLNTQQLSIMDVNRLNALCTEEGKNPVADIVIKRSGTGLVIILTPKSQWPETWVTTSGILVAA